MIFHAKDDKLASYNDTERAVSRFPDCAFVPFESGGHLLTGHGEEIKEADIPVAERFYQNPAFVAAIRQMNRQPAEFLTVTEGDVFDLGGLSLEVYELPGHTPGGIVLLDRKDRILFSGDSILEQTWMQLPECLPMEQFLASLDKIQKMRGEFDYLLTGHNLELVDASPAYCSTLCMTSVPSSAGRLPRSLRYFWARYSLSSCWSISSICSE